MLGDPMYVFWRVVGGLLLSLFFVGCSSDGDGTSLEDEESTTTSTPTSTPTAEEQPPAEADPVALATTFMDARNEGDLETTLALLTPDAEIHDFGRWPRTPDEYQGLMEWFEIFNWRWAVQECTETSPGPPVRVTCDYLMENDWSRAIDVDPVPGRLEFLVRGGVIEQVDSDTGAWVEQVWFSWLEWLETFHRAQIPVLYRFDEAGDLTGGPATSPEALDLYREYLPEFEAWVGDR